MANKLYILNYILEDIERFATTMLLSAVDQAVSDINLAPSVSAEQRTEGEVLAICFFACFFIDALYSFLLNKCQKDSDHEA